jgi:ATP-dependent Clp protease protease subunit
MSNLVPMVITREGNSERSMDLYSRVLNDRIVFLQGEVNDMSANLLIAEMLFLEGENPKDPIIMYINSPGGSVTAGLAIKNTMDYVKCPVHTIGMGMCASMGAFLLASGEKGNRLVLPDTTVMIHQVLGGYQGQCTDMQIHAKYAQSLKDKLTNYLVSYTNGKVSKEEMYAACERDNFLTAEEALDMGLIDGIVKEHE